MKKHSLILLGNVCVLLFSLLMPQSALAAASPQTAQPVPTISFSDLGYAQDLVLQGPYGSATLTFSLPPEWRLLPGAELQLELSAYFSTLVIGQEDQNLDTINAGQLEVTLNGAPLPDTVLQGRGDKTLNFLLPEAALLPDSVSGLHTLTIQWNAGATCEINLATSIILHPTSRLILPITLVTPKIDLGRFPWPLIQPTAGFNRGVTLVLPDQPSASELEAALAIAARLGRDSGGLLDLIILPESQVNTTRRDSTHLILTGRTAALKMLQDIDLPQPPPGLAADDGLLRMAASPWNESLLVIAVGGQSDLAVLKAGRGLSAGNLLTNPAGDTTVLIALQPSAAAQSSAIDQTFADLQYSSLTFTRFGSSRQSIVFDLPYGMKAGADAYLDLAFNHSQLMDYLRSGIIVRLNDEPVGSVRLSDTTADYNRLRMILPASSLRPGRNELAFQVDLQPRTICLDPRMESLWVTIFADSLLHLPPGGQLTRKINDLTLGDYPSALLDTDPANLVFVLPADEPAAWQAAGLLAFDLGSQGCHCETGLKVNLASQSLTADLENASLVIVGSPAKLPILSSLGEVLPMSFDSNNQLSPTSQSKIAFRSAEGSSLGYLQSAWLDSDNNQLAFAILGTDDAGLVLAARTLIDARTRPALKNGNFSLLQGGQIVVETIRPGQVSPDMVIPAGDQPAQLPAPTSQSPAAPQASSFAPWMLPALILAVSLVIILLVWEIYTNTQNQKKA